MKAPGHERGIFAPHFIYGRTIEVSHFPPKNDDFMLWQAWFYSLSKSFSSSDAAMSFLKIVPNVQHCQIF